MFPIYGVEDAPRERLQIRILQKARLVRFFLRYTFYGCN